MSDLRSNAETNDDPDDQWVRVGSYGSIDQAFEHSLVLLSQGSGCRIQPVGVDVPAFDLEAPIASEPLARNELALYQKECDRPVIHEPSLAEHGPGVTALLIWAITLLVSHRMQMEFSQWENIGMNSSIGLIENREWWRPFTALFLHADLGHLLSNLLTGSLFALMLCRMWGAVKSWIAILLAGTLGNIANSAMNYPEQAFSLGASTAVMAALGLLTATGITYAISRRDMTQPLRQVAVPLAAGVALLGLTGNSTSPDVNVFGHLCGFAAGLITGFPIARFVRKQDVASHASA